MRDLEIIYEEDFIFTVDPHSEVMGRWETPLMQVHSNLCAHNNGDILEIGFGLGISASQIQDIGVNSHTIIEIHPVIAQKAREWAVGKNGVNIIEGDWYDLKDQIIQKKYDGIFFDPHMDPNRHLFRSEVVEKSIKPRGVFTWFHYGNLDFFEYGQGVEHIELEVVSGFNTRMMAKKSTVMAPYFIY